MDTKFSNSGTSDLKILILCLSGQRLFMVPAQCDILTVAPSVLRTLSWKGVPGDITAHHHCTGQPANEQSKYAFIRKHLQNTRNEHADISTVLAD